MTTTGPGRSLASAIPEPGSRSAVRKSKTVGLLWKGKVFHGDGTGHNRVLGRDASPQEAELLAQLLSKHRSEFAADGKAAEELVSVGVEVSRDGHSR